MENFNNEIKIPDRIWFGDFLHIVRPIKFIIGEGGKPLLSSDSKISVTLFKEQVHYGELIVPAGEYIEFAKHYGLF